MCTGPEIIPLVGRWESSLFFPGVCVAEEVGAGKWGDGKVRETLKIVKCFDHHAFEFRASESTRDRELAKFVVLIISLE